jgi:hypothetical protein
MGATAGSRSTIKRTFGKSKKIHENDLKNGFVTVYLPYAIARKYPNVKFEWNYQVIIMWRQHDLYSCD